MKLNITDEWSSNSVEGFAKNDRVVVRVGKDEWYTGTVAKNGASKMVIDLDPLSQAYIDEEMANLNTPEPADDDIFDSSGMSAEELARHVLEVETKAEDELEKARADFLANNKAGEEHDVEVEAKDIRWVKKLQVSDIVNRKLTNTEAKALLAKLPPPAYLKKYETVKPKLAAKHIPTNDTITKYAPSVFNAVYEIVKGNSSPVQLTNLDNPETTRSWLVDANKAVLTKRKLNSKLTNMGFQPPKEVMDAKGNYTYWKRDRAEVRIEEGFDKKPKSKTPNTVTKVKHNYLKVTIKIGAETDKIPVVPVLKREKVTIQPQINIANLEKDTVLIATDTVHGRIHKNDKVTVSKVANNKESFQVKTEDNKLIILPLDDLKLFKEV